MLDQPRRVQFRWRVRPERVIADTTHGTIANIRTLEDQGIRAYVPLADFDHRTSYYGRDRFTYDAKRGDEYRCPARHPMRRRTATYADETVVYRAKAATCNACPLKARCMTSDDGRQVRRSIHEDYLDGVRG